MFGQIIYCLTAQQCEGQTLTSDGNINCGGYESCHLASLIDSDGLTYDEFKCDADRSSMVFHCWNLVLLQDFMVISQEHIATNW